MLIMTPLRRFSSGKAYLAQSHGPFRLTSTTRANSTAVNSSIGLNRAMPALLTRISRPPKCLAQRQAFAWARALTTVTSRRLNQPCLRAVCACGPAPAALRGARSGRRAACQAASRGARTAGQLEGSFQWRGVGDRVARAGGGKGPLIFLYLRLAYRQSAGEGGFTREEFRALAQDVAGPDLRSWFVSVLETTEDLDYPEALQWFGLRFKTATPATPAKAWLGLVTRTDN